MSSIGPLYPHSVIDSGSNPLAVVQSAQNATTSPSTTVAATFPGNTVTGNLIVVCINGGTNAVSGVTDSDGNTYVAADTGDLTYSDCEIWYAANITGGTTPTVTVTNAAAQASTVQIYEIVGADQSSPFDV